MHKFLKKHQVDITNLTSLKNVQSELLQNQHFLSFYFNTERPVSEYSHIPETMLSNPFFVYKAIEQNPDIIFLAPKELMDDDTRNFLIANNPKTYLRFMDHSQTTQSDYEKAVSSSSFNLFYVPQKNLTKTIIFSAFSPYSDLHLNSCPENQTIQNFIDRRIIAKKMFELLPKTFSEDQNFMEELLHKSKYIIFPYVKPSFKQKIEQIVQALEISPKNYKYTPYKFTTKDSMFQILSLLDPKRISSIIPYLDNSIFDDKFYTLYQRHLDSQTYKLCDTSMQSDLRFLFNTCRAILDRADFQSYSTHTVSVRQEFKTVAQATKITEFKDLINNINFKTERPESLQNKLASLEQTLILQHNFLAQNGHFSTEQNLRKKYKI